MTSRRRRIATPVLLAAFLSAISYASAASRADEPVTLFAAASTVDAVGLVARAFAANGGGEVRTVFAASSTLARQIAQGAPADLYLSANVAWMDDLEGRGAIETATRIDLLGNALVLIAPKRDPLNLEIAPGFPLARVLSERRLAMGDPAHVPAGIYAKAALERLKVWPEVARRVAYLGDVRGALAMVDRGEAAAGIVYASDVRGAAHVQIAGVFPAGSHPAIVYPLAVVTGHGKATVMAFYDFLRGEKARTLFESQGFTVPNAAPDGGS